MQDEQQKSSFRGLNGMEKEPDIVQDEQQKSDMQVIQSPASLNNPDIARPVTLPRPARRGNRRRLIFVAVLLVLVVAIGVVFYVISQISQGASYAAMSVFSGNLQLTAIAAGSVQAETYQANFATTNGIVAAIDVSVGQQVQAGQKLAELNTTTLEDQLKVAQAQLQEAQSAGSGVQVAQAQVAQAQDNLNAATLTAPHAGTITAINGLVGGTSAGSASNGFIDIADMSALDIVLNVNEADIGHVAVGNVVNFTINAYGNRTFIGKVAAVAQSGQAGSGVNNSIITYPVTVSMNSSSLQGTNLIPGMIVDATITTITRQHVLLILDSAVSFAQTSATQGLVQTSAVQSAKDQANTLLSNMLSNQGTSLWQDNPSASYVLVQQNGQLVVQPVVLGLTDGNFYEVLSGLKANDTVVFGPNGASAASPANGIQQQAPSSSGSGR
jgi:multidrug efflux pump subunit AcrA (membrane-fusion protein)